MTTFGLAAGALYPLIHLGRVWVFYWMIPYPNARWLWPNFRSPLVWDFLAITTYLLSSTIYLFLPLIPDLAMARDRTTGWRHAIYQILALGWRGTEAEWFRLRKAINIFAFAIIPVMFSVHTIVSWDFAVGADRRAGTRPSLARTSSSAPSSPASRRWSPSCIVLRSTMKNMNYFIRPEHFDALGKLVLIFSMAWAYFFFNDYMVCTGTAATQAVRKLLTFARQRSHCLDLVLHADLQHRHPLADAVEQEDPPHALGYVHHHPADQRGHVLRALHHHPADPGPPAHALRLGRVQPAPAPISPSSSARFCLFIFLYLLASRLIPLVPVWEVQEGQIAHQLRKVGKTTVPSVTELE